MNDLEELDDLAVAALAAHVQPRIDDKTRPLGALGRIEAPVLRIALVLGTGVGRWCCALKTRVGCSSKGWCLRPTTAWLRRATAPARKR